MKILKNIDYLRYILFIACSAIFAKPMLYLRTMQYRIAATASFRDDQLETGMGGGKGLVEVLLRIG